MRPDALLVDAHGTLIHLVDPAATTYAEVAARHGVVVSPSLLARRMRDAMGQHDPATGTAYWRAVVRDTLDSEDPALFDALFQTFADPERWRVDGRGVQLVDEARSLGLPVAVVSNFDQRLGPLMRALGIEVDAMVLACDVGRAKPHPEAFAEAARRLGALHPLHVGDHPIEDVQGARDAGMDAVHLQSSDDWERVRTALWS